MVSGSRLIHAAAPIEPIQPAWGTGTSGKLHNREVVAAVNPRFPGICAPRTRWRKVRVPQRREGGLLQSPFGLLLRQSTEYQGGHACRTIALLQVSTV
jgi:hypothetical protein